MTNIIYSIDARKLTPCPFKKAYGKFGIINVGTVPCDMCMSHYHNDTANAIVTCRETRK